MEASQVQASGGGGGGGCDDRSSICIPDPPAMMAMMLKGDVEWTPRFGSVKEMLNCWMYSSYESLLAAIKLGKEYGALQKAYDELQKASLADKEKIKELEKSLEELQSSKKIGSFSTTLHWNLSAIRPTNNESNSTKNQVLCFSYLVFSRDKPTVEVLVTGASSGLGWEFCLDLAKAGCRIIAAARRIERLKSLCHEINSKSTSGGDQAVAVELDLRANGTLIEAAVHKAWDAFGRIDVLINNAGVRGRVHTPFNLSEDEWNDIIRTNLTGTWLVSKFVCARMCDAKIGGSVINISSIIGTERGFLLGGLVYACSKAAVNTMTKVMALEYGKYNIKVNAISPGIFRSEITEGLLEKDWIRNFQQKTVPLKTFGTSDPALTSLVRYLLEDSSAHVSGNIFMVDAGASLAGFPIFSSL